MPKPQAFQFVTKSPVRVSYPNFFAPDHLAEKYSAFFLIPKNDDATKAALGAALNLAREEGAKVVWGQAIPNATTTLYDGDAPKAKGGAWPEEYKGHLVLKATSNFPTKVYDPAKNLIAAGSPEAANIHGGVLGYPVISFTPQDVQGTKSIKAYLDGFMFVKDDGVNWGGGGGAAVLDALADIPVDTSLPGTPPAAGSALNSLLGV